MRWTIAFIVSLTCVVFASCSHPQDTPKCISLPKAEIYRVRLSDGFTLKIETERPGVGKRTMRVDVVLFSKEGIPVWYYDVTSVPGASSTDYYYALVKVLEDRIFIFFTWNGQYCIIDKQTGRVLQRGEGDDLLRGYGSLVPLRLTAESYPSSTANQMKTL